MKCDAVDLKHVNEPLQKQLELVTRRLLEDLPRQLCELS
jgi:hypothetical protein